ncbi:biotin transporter BioY [Alicyclobacillus tolerans]|uniref:biotin transporter BioY n=1 Tax=Alicyclobacillus tolerans TaxID=90970 RepID=UPI001F38D8E0|nr:biotin transporter BioY [Alicyclobacillus tolerans]MCF8566415.1 biotin transporter BioY [Alicyclobacillus tolerans]
MGSKITVRGVVFSALFAALMVVLSWVNIHLPFTPVPITLENMVVMLAGAILGAGYGFFSMLLVVVLTALGLPLLHGSGGLALILGPTGGYVWMYPFGALLTGFFATRAKGNGVGAWLQVFLAAEVFGSLLCYVTGVPWLAHTLHMPFSKAMVAGFYPYIPGDAIKAVLTAVVVSVIRPYYPASRLVGKTSAQVAALPE